MARVIDVVFKPHGLVAFFDDNTKLEAVYRTIDGKPRLIGITEVNRNAIVDYYNRAQPSVQADIRFLALIRANESITEDEHTAIDHFDITGVGGGAATGTPRRYYFPLENAKLTTGLVSITGSTTPSIEISSGLTRIAWPVANTGGVAFTAGIPFEDHDTSGAFNGTLKLAFSQDGSEVVSGTIILGVDLDGGGSITPSTSFSWVGDTSIVVATAGTLSTDATPPVTNVRQVFFSITSTGSSTDILYLNSAWFEVDLI